MIPSIAAFAVLALAAAGVGLVAGPALASGELTGSVVGHVTVALPGTARVADADEVMVTPYLVDPDDGSVVTQVEWQDTTDASGYYDLGQLPVGDWAFEFSYRGAEVNRVGGFSTGHNEIEEVVADGAVQTLLEGATVGPHFFVGFGAIANGDVRNASLAALPGQPVELWRETYSNYGPYYRLVGETDTDSLGHYHFDSLPAGNYGMRAGGAAGYIAEFWNNKYVNAVDEADDFHLSAPGSYPLTYTKDVLLGTGARVTGTVKNTSGYAVSGIVVTPYRYSDVYGEFVPYESAIRTTATNGTYSLTGLPPGDYKVGFASPDFATLGYQDQYWSKQASLDSAAEFTLAAGDTKASVNASLTRAGVVRGVVSLAGGGFPAAGDVQISACPQWGGCTIHGPGYDGVVGDYNPATGAYSISPLKSGKYFVQVQYLGAGNFQPEWSGGGHLPQSAVAFAVASTSSISGKNFVLDPGFTITGNVQLDGSPVVGGELSVYLADYGDRYPEYDALKTVATDSSGDYVLTGLPQANYLVRAEDTSAGTARQWNGGGYSAQGAPYIRGVGTTTHSGEDFDLVRAGVIQGMVFRTGDGEPVYNAEVVLEGPNIGDARLATATTDDWGTYRFDGLPPGTYLVHAYADQAYPTGLLDGYFGGRLVADATPVELTPGEYEPSSDIPMYTGGIYTGLLVDSEGDPIPDTDLVVEDGSGETATTDENGEFRLDGLETGTHSVRVDGTDGFVAKYVFDAPATTVNAEPVPLDPIVLERESSISGVVIGVDGKALKNVGVSAMIRGSDGEMTQYWATGTDASGRFTVDRLPTEAIYLFLVGPSGYPAQYLGGGTDWAFSEPVVFTSEGSTAFREVRLLKGGTVTGTVTNKATGAVIPSIPVWASDRGSDGYTGSATTNSKGAYSIPGLSPGSYDVTFNTRATGAGFTYTSETKTVYVPDRTTVTLNSALTRSASVKGTVRDGGNVPLAGVKVTASPVAGGDDLDVWTDAAGNYSVPLWPGKWRLFFSDPEGRVGSVFYGGSLSSVTATQLTVAATTLSGRNVTMPAPTGAIDVESIYGADDPYPWGAVLLQRLESGDPVSSQQVEISVSGWPTSWFSLNKAFPLRNLADGTYRLVIQAYNASDEFGGDYPIKVIDDIEVAGGATTSIGGVNLGSAELVESWMAAEVIAGEGPVASSDGSPAVGEWVSISDSGTWDQEISDFAFQWLRDGKPIPGAVDECYLLAPGDAGHTISARVAAAAANGYWGYAVATVDGTVEAGSSPVVLDPASVSGRAFVGQTVTANSGNWDLPGLSFRYQWQRDGADLAGARSAGYKLTTSDVGHAITVIITARRTGFADGTTSAALAGLVQPAVALKQTIASKVTALVGGYKVTPGTWSPTGATFDYVWRVYDGWGSYTSYATGPIGQLDDPGVRAGTERVTVVVTASKPGYTSTSVEVPVRTGPVPSFLLMPALLGTPQVGNPITLDLSGVMTAPSSVTYSFQWYKGTTAISGATKVSYTPRAVDLGASLSVRVTIKAPGYAAPSAPQIIYPAANPVAGAGVFAPGTPTISGVAAVGRKLTANPGSWDPAPSFTYQWLRNNVPITGAISSTLALTSIDLNKDITVKVTGSRDGYAKVFAISDPVTVSALALQPVTPPTLPATANVGTKLTVKLGTWDLAPTSYAYQWYVNGVALDGATASTFTPRVTDLGEDLSVTVVGKRSGYANSIPVGSLSVTVDPGAPIAATAAPKLSVGGLTVTSVKLGKTIASTAGTWPVAALGLSYQWQVDRADGNGWVSLDGATTKTLYLDPSAPADFAVTFKYRMVVSATHAGYLPGGDAVSGSLTVVP